MTRFISFCGFIFLIFNCSANDGVFRVNGNQLIPMYETDISVKKEILSIRRINKRQAEISVYYEFFNPKGKKIIEVGFEAFSPTGDVNVTASETHDPFISRFTVSLNDEPLPWKVVSVNDSLYFQNGHYKSKPVSVILSGGDYESASFIYVYHFRAIFRNGLNVIRHTYTVDLSSSVAEAYSLEYVLTAAKRWSNRQIDDFTLQIDMGEFQDIAIEQTFFKNNSDWILPANGKGAIAKTFTNAGDVPMASRFFIRKGILVFHRISFKPSGELFLSSPNSTDYSGREGNQGEFFDQRSDKLPFSVQNGYLFSIAPLDSLSMKILLNLPYARRGNIFKKAELQEYFRKMVWYLPDSSYRPGMSALPPDEQNWLKLVMRKHIGP